MTDLERRLVVLHQDQLARVDELVAHAALRASVAVAVGKVVDVAGELGRAAIEAAIAGLVKGALDNLQVR